MLLLIGLLVLLVLVAVWYFLIRVPETEVVVIPVIPPTRSLTNTTGSLTNTTGSLTNTTRSLTNTTRSLTNTTGSLTNTTAASTVYAPLSADYPYGPYHFGPTCDSGRKILVDPAMMETTERGTCKILGGEYDQKFNGADANDIPYSDKTPVRCNKIPICRNPPDDNQIFIGKYDLTNTKMIGSFDKENINFPTALCRKFNGVIRSGETYANQQCKLGLYKKKDLPDGKFLMPGSISNAPPGLTKVGTAPYYQSFALPMGDCRKMGGVWNGGTVGKTDDSPVDCHLTWYTNMAL